MIKACAWCDKEQGTDRDGQTVTHGICERHLAEMDVELELIGMKRRAQVCIKETREALSRYGHL